MCAAKEVKDKKDPAFSLMQVGAYVLIRYATSQRDSVHGDGWRKVEVLCEGHVRETDYGRDEGPSGYGWWVRDPKTPSDYKFFLKRRIIDLLPWRFDTSRY